MRVSINILERNPNAIRVCTAFAEGVGAAGNKAIRRTDRDCNMAGFDVAVFWGYVETCQHIEKCARAANIPFIYVDLAYWGREHGYYKASINHRHPTHYLMKKAMPPDRWERLKLPIRPWAKTSDGPVIVAGMSGKGAWSWGFVAKDVPWNKAGNSYEREVVEAIKNRTKRPIIYRPKPNWHQATQIIGTQFDRLTPIHKLLSGAHCVITHHSNVATDAVIAGVPVFTRHSAALHMGLPDSELARVENPAYPDGREQWAANLAYCQWTLQEMSDGTCWRHIRSQIKEGIV